MAKISLGPLKALLNTHVCEVKFVRRVPIPGTVMTRRMLCTNSLQILSSPDGRMTLNFRPATRGPKYNPGQKNLILTWDIFMCDYRQINCSACDLVNKIPATEWWDYFRKTIAPMTTAQKMVFMDI